ncbi:MAG: GTPase Era [Acidobacteriota bacterium]
MSESSESRGAGRVILLGRPNAGKSTLMNHLLAEKVAIVSDKPQTTRSRIVGVLSEERGQVVFLDTPGIHKPQHRMNRRMVRSVSDALVEADLIVVVVDSTVRRRGVDERLVELVRGAQKKALLALNKTDICSKPKLLPMIEDWHATGLFEAIVPISALDGEGCDVVLDLIFERLPKGEPEFDEELLTPHSERFLVAERIREKLLELLREELPFATAVVIDDWQEPEGAAIRIAATILVERGGQKKIVIGRRGEMIKKIGTLARHDLIEYLGGPVHLDLHVKQETAWRENARRLGELEREAQRLV